MAAPAPSSSATEASPRSLLPRAEEFLYWPPTVQPYGYRIVDQLFASRPVRASGQPRALPRGPELALRYDAAGTPRGLDEFMQRNHGAGLLILHEGRIVFERYGLGLREQDRWSTMSTVKSMTAMLVGAALRDGALASLDDRVVTHLPALAGSAYERVTVRHLLTMSSGVRWTEVYEDPDSDVNRYSASMARQVPGGVLALMRSLSPQHEPGTVFAYNSGDTYLLGALLSAATDSRLADYLSRKVWTPMGMEFDAFYTLESADGQEIGGSRAGMALRDFGRFAQFVLDDGVIDGQPSFPAGWVDDCARPAFEVTDPLRRADGITGYGYSWWLTDDGALNALGHAGQRIWIDRAHRTAAVILSAVPQPPWRPAGIPDTAAETRALLRALREAVAGA